MQNLPIRQGLLRGSVFLDNRKRYLSADLGELEDSEKSNQQIVKRRNSSDLDMYSIASSDACFMSIEQTQRKLGVGDLSKGIKISEVKDRQKMHGYNDFEVNEDTPLYKKYLQQFSDPLILMLLASAFLSVLMKQFDDAFSIAAAIAIVVTVGCVQEYKSERTLKAMTKLVPPETVVLQKIFLKK